MGRPRQHPYAHRDPNDSPDRFPAVRFPMCCSACLWLLDGQLLKQSYTALASSPVTGGNFSGAWMLRLNSRKIVAAKANRRREHAKGGEQAA